MDRLILNFNTAYNDPHITIAAMDKSYHRSDCNKFIFNKSYSSSKQFLAIMKESSLIVCADSGPLHIAIALKKDLMALFNSTEPEIAINSGTYLAINHFFK